MNGIPSVAVLLSLDSEEFIERAYLILLGRSADEDGARYYLARLKTGYSKLSVLAQLQRSPEAQAEHQVAGLNKLLRRYRLGRLPFLGLLFRRFWKIEGEGVHERLQRAMAEGIRSANRLVAQHGDHMREIRDIMSDVRQQLHENADSAAAFHKDLVERVRMAPITEARRNTAAERLSERGRKAFERLTSA